MTDEPNIDTPDAAPRQRRRNGDQAPLDVLVGTEFEGWPEVEQGEREAYWQVTSETYLGNPPYRCLQEVGNKIVFGGIPNDALYPLNRAAAVNLVKWRNSLPQTGVAIDAGDHSEAAQMLAKDPDALKLPPHEWHKAVLELAIANKRRRGERDPRDGMTLPPLGHNFTHKTSNAPPLLGARFAQMSDGTFAGAGSFGRAPNPQAVLGPGAVRRVGGP